MKKIFILFFTIFSFIIKAYGQFNSVLAEGEWYKIATTNSGIYKLSYNNIQSLGVSTNNLLISSLKIYGNGGGMLPHLNSDFRHKDLVENAISVYDANNNGIFESSDYILFYGQSPDTWHLDTLDGFFKHKKHLFSDYTNYFLTVNNISTGKRIASKQFIQNSANIITTFDDFAFHESDNENLISSGRNWFGERLDIQNNQSFSFIFPNLDLSTPVNVKTAVVARSLVPSVFTVSANSIKLFDINVSNILPNYASEYAKISSRAINYSSNSSNLSINIEYSSTDNNASAWLDYIEINAKRLLKMNSSMMLFRSTALIDNEVATYHLSNTTSAISIWDVSNPTEIKALSTTFDSGTLLFTDSINKLREYIAFDGNSLLTPILLGSVNNQNLHNTSSDVEYVIITSNDFMSAAKRLAEFHEVKDDLKSVIVTPEQIYNEFSSGIQDVSAIRDYLRMLYKRSNSALKYVLLYGDGSFDPKDRVSNNTNYIPTYQSENSLSPTLSYVTDDYFALLDDNEGLFLNDLVDIGIGRLPVSNLQQANIVADKIEHYYSNNSFGSWRNDIAFVADDGDAKDGNTHMSQADSLAKTVAKNHIDININKIYLDNYFQESTSGGPRSESAQNAINNRVDKGALLINYTGHGGPLGWSAERILEIDQIQNWDNISNLPLFMTATCKFSYFDNPEEISAGEYLILNPNGGAIALLTTTRLVYSAPNYNLNNKFIKTVFEKENGEFQRLGDIFKTTKALSGTSVNNRNFTLLGDPALRLAYPQYDIVTNSIEDTLKALGEFTILGEVKDANGVLNSFNGTVYPTVYDKVVSRNTLGQESCTPMPYQDQNNILYKGAATVLNGRFSFSFVVPKDIAYNYGSGKISYYAVSNDVSSIDAGGSDTAFFIGGTSEDVIYDYDGPSLELFLNTRNFENGGITDKNPELIVDIEDFSGINTVGNGIGHDIVAVLDGATNDPFVLNQYYEAAKDNYKKGVVRFPFNNLEIGEHTINVKVWDVFNNSSSAEINFIVTEENSFVISDYSNRPNPFSNSTAFYFQHNKVNQDLDVVLDIYSITGSLVKSFNKRYFDNGYAIGPIEWDGRNGDGRKLVAGMYIAKLSVISSDGDFNSKSIRIILLPSDLR